MAKLTSFPGGVLFGAGLMYLLDPVRGRRRRARIHEAVMRAERAERELLDKAARDVKQRMQGFTHRPPADAPDEVIEQRVRACLGRAVSHPGALDVVVRDGRVILRGPVLEGEAPLLARQVRGIPGVQAVVDRMDRHASAGSIPALQGQGRSRAMRHFWSPALQVAATGAGAAMVLYGWLVRGGAQGTLVGTAGAALALRATFNRPMPELLGRRGTVTVTKTITVRRPIHEVFELWSRLDNFPQFMEHVREIDVELGGTRSRWTVDGPAGTKVEFEAETIACEPDQLIAWRTLPGQPIHHEGRVRFDEPRPGETRVHVDMTYRPPGGVIGHAIAHLLGWDPKARMDDDLVRMKALLEEGRTRAHMQRVELADLH